MLHKSLIVALSAAPLFLIVGVAVFLPGAGQEPPAQAAGSPDRARIEGTPADEPMAVDTAAERELVTPDARDEVAGTPAAASPTGALRVRVTQPGDGAGVAGIGVATAPPATAAPMC